MGRGDGAWTGEGESGSFSAAGSGDLDTDREETLLADSGLGEANFSVLLGSGVRSPESGAQETLVKGLILGDGDCLLDSFLLLSKVSTRCLKKKND